MCDEEGGQQEDTDMPSPRYGDADYWDRRYGVRTPVPFDWLFSYQELKGIIESLLPDRDARILIPGCGNAPFSVDMHLAGYRNIVNADLSTVVVASQRDHHPDIHWDVGDVMDMAYPDASFDAVIDKSLIDTLMCMKNGASCVHRMLDEIHRVLRPQGLYLCMSLHRTHEVLVFLARTPRDTRWSVTTGNLFNPAWGEREAEEEHDDDDGDKSVTFTLAACRKAHAQRHKALPKAPELPGTLTDKEVEVLMQRQRLRARRNRERKENKHMMAVLKARCSSSTGEVLKERRKERRARVNHGGDSNQMLDVGPRGKASSSHRSGDAKRGAHPWRRTSVESLTESLHRALTLHTT